MRREASSTAVSAWVGAGVIDMPASAEELFAMYFCDTKGMRDRRHIDNGDHRGDSDGEERGKQNGNDSIHIRNPYAL